MCGEISTHRSFLSLSHLLSCTVEMSQAVKAGTVPKEMIQRFVDMSNNPFLAWLMTFGYVAGLFLEKSICCFWSCSFVVVCCSEVSEKGYWPILPS